MIDILKEDEKNSRDLWGIIRLANILIMIASEGEEKERSERLFENFQILGKT